MKECKHRKYVYVDNINKILKFMIQILPEITLVWHILHPCQHIFISYVSMTASCT